MADLPEDVSTGIVRIRIHAMTTTGDVSSTRAVTGKVIFTPSPTFLSHAGTGTMISPTPSTVFLEGGEGQITLMATDDPDIDPVDWTYKVSFVLEEASIASFHIQVPSGSDEDLSDIAPVPSSDGTYYTKGEDGVATPQSIADVLGVALVSSPTAPTATSLYGKPVLWISGGAALQPVPVQPQVPTFDMVNYTVTAPSLVGVQYQVVDGANTIVLTPSTAISFAGYTRPYLITVQAVAKPGYVLTSAYSWQRYFVDASSQVLYASDSFAGTPLQSLAPVGVWSAGGRVFDMAGGGNAGTPPSWLNYVGNGEPGSLMIDATGTKLTKNTAAAIGNKTQGRIEYPVGALNWRLELDLTKLPITHSHAIILQFGRATNVSGCVAEVNIGVNVNTINVTYTALGGVSSAVMLYRGPNATEAMILGTWSFLWLNKVLQITAPDTQTFTKDYSASSITAGNYGQIGVVGTGPSGPYPEIDNVRVYR